MASKSSSLTDLLLSIVIPSIILMKFSDGDELGARGALIVALAFPIALGLCQLIRIEENFSRGVKKYRHRFCNSSYS
jgi:hypothetical protein